MQRYASWFRDNEGRGYPGAIVTVYDAGTSNLALLYSASSIAPLPITNPQTTDPNGFYQFAVSNGSYDIQIQAGGMPTTIIPNWVANDVTPVGFDVRPQLASTGAGNGAEMIGYLAPFTGTVATTQNEVNNALGINVKSSFDAKGDGVTDDTLAIQKAINAASHSSLREVYLPGGTYNYTRLYCYYDASLNPGYLEARNGAVSLIGDGVPFDDHSTVGGTVLNCTSTTGDGIVVSPAALDDGATTALFKSRRFYAEGISFTGANSGYLMAALGVPGFKTVNCQFVVSHANGSALRLSSAWVGSLEETNFTTYPYNFATTGKAIAFSTTLAGGLLTLRDCSVSVNYAYGLHHLSGAWQNLNIVDSQISGSTYAVYSEAAIQLLSIRGSYFEGACTSFIADAAANNILQLSVRDCWFHAAGITGASIDLHAPNAVNVDDCFVQDQEVSGKAFLNIATYADATLQRPYRASNVTFIAYGTPVATTLFTGQIPALYGIEWYAYTGTVLLHPAGKYPIKTTQDTISTGTISAGRFIEPYLDSQNVSGGATIVLTSWYPNDIPTFFAYYAAGAAVTIRLPSIAWMTSKGFGAGYCIGIRNHISSGAAGIITDGEGSPTTMCNLAAGDYRKFVYSGTAWL